MVSYIPNKKTKTGFKDDEYMLKSIIILLDNPICQT